MQLNYTPRMHDRRYKKWARDSKIVGTVLQNCVKLAIQRGKKSKYGISYYSVDELRSSTVITPHVYSKTATIAVMVIESDGNKNCETVDKLIGLKHSLQI